MGKQFHSTLYWACDYQSMLASKLNNVNKGGPGLIGCEHIRMQYVCSNNTDKVSSKLSSSQLYSREYFHICKYDFRLPGLAPCKPRNNLITSPRQKLCFLLYFSFSCDSCDLLIDSRQGIFNIVTLIN